MGECARAFVGDYRWMWCLNKCTRVWALLFESDALQPYNQSSSQRFEHGVAESRRRRLEREREREPVLSSVRYCLSLCVILYWVCEWISAIKPTWAFRVVETLFSYRLSPALKKIISRLLLRKLLLKSKESCNMLLSLYENQCHSIFTFSFSDKLHLLIGSGTYFLFSQSGPTQRDVYDKRAFQSSVSHALEHIQFESGHMSLKK